MSGIKLTAFSHGYGCGCKIAPSVLEEILKGNKSGHEFPALIVGNNAHDDAAVLEIGNGQGLISTTDFFMPIVDDAFDFGRIAATNAISDVYAMGGKPLLAVAILGWPVDKLPAELASGVLAGGRKACEAAGIPLAGGHSIDSPEPIFGLAVNGTIALKNLKRNNTAKAGDLLFLSKPIGTGIITTAAKKGIVTAEHLQTAITLMTTLNAAGEKLAWLEKVHAMTDVTGFGLFGHLIEMAEGSGLTAEIKASDLPLIPGISLYLEQYAIPAITYRNWNSYGNKTDEPDVDLLHLGCDPQTSGGLLVAADPSLQKVLEEEFRFTYIGRLTEQQEKIIRFL